MTNLKPWHWQQASYAGAFEILKGDNTEFHVFFEKTAEKIVTELNTQADTIASLQAELAEARAEISELEAVIADSKAYEQMIVDGSDESSAPVDDSEEWLNHPLAREILGISPNPTDSANAARIEG